MSSGTQCANSLTHQVRLREARAPRFLVPRIYGAENVAACFPVVGSSSCHSLELSFNMMRMILGVEPRTRSRECSG